MPNAGCTGLQTGVGFDPGPDAECVDAYAKQVGRDEPELMCMKADNTDNKAVNP
jgi:hypothetical protein